MVDLLLQFAQKSGNFKMKILIFVGIQFQTPKERLLQKNFEALFRISCLKEFDLLSLATMP